MKNIHVGLISIICLSSLVANVVLFQSWLRHEHQVQFAEAMAMTRVADDINQANAWMKHFPTAAVGRLTEAGGVLSTLQDTIPTSNGTANNLYKVRYYLHYQGTATSFDGLSQFMTNANKLIQSHMSQGQYNVAYFSSDIASLDGMLPASFR